MKRIGLNDKPFSLQRKINRYNIYTMKKNKLLFLGLMVTSLLLTSCKRNVQYEITTLDKQDINYTYREYFDHNIYDLDATPTTGNPKLLVVPIWFTDSSLYLNEVEKVKVKQDIEKAYFGTNEETGWRSVKTFYEEESSNLLTLSGVVTNWYTDTHPSSYYYTDIEKTAALVTKVVNWYKTLTSDDLKSFDSDHNGYLDGVMLIYGSPDYRAMNNKNRSNMWAYCYWLQQNNRNVNNPNPNQFFWASYDFMYGSGGPGEYHSGNTTYASIDTHTFIHEMGHCFGLEDYYDYSDQFNPAGGFSMQDFNVGGHDPYSVMAYGWAKPYVPTENCTIKIKEFQSSREIVLLSNNFVNSVFDEYLLLELYSPTGLNQFDSEHSYGNSYPQGPRYTGIRLWHIDARLLYLRNGDETYSSQRISNIIESDKWYRHLCSNTYYDASNPDSKDYISPLGKKYADYNILQLIRNSVLSDYEDTASLNEIDLFYKGDSFNISRYHRQFVNDFKLNNGTTLGWTFTVNDISNGEATITFKKS